MKKAAGWRPFWFGGGGENGFAVPGGSPLRGALRASKTDFVAFCELATLIRLALSNQTKKPPRWGGFPVWWRWRESNSRPQALCPKVYMLIPSLISP
jgi:hypothetical protein